MAPRIMILKIIHTPVGTTHSTRLASPAAGDRTPRIPQMEADHLDCQIQRTMIYVAATT